MALHERPCDILSLLCGHHAKIWPMEGFLDSLKISYTDHQKTTASTSAAVVFIHGFPFDRTMWSAQVSAIGASARVITYDHRGLGKSPLREQPFLFESFVDDLMALLDQLHIEKAILCGLSMGGYVALRATERHPERVKGLVLCDTKSDADPDAAKLNRHKDALLIQNEGLHAFAIQFVRRCLTANTVQTNPALVANIEAMIQRCPVQGVIGTLVALATRTSTTDSLSHIKAPTLILVGDQDAITPPSASQMMKERIPGSVLTVIPQAAHLSNLENPHAFNTAFLRFLQSLSR